MHPQHTLEPLPEDWTKALAIAAHPDDLEYGSASAIARWTAQREKVSYLLLTRGEAGIDAMPPEQTASIREAEERRSAETVGVQEVEFLNYRDGVIEYGLSLRRDIARAVRKYRPEAVITVNHHLTFGGALLNMADHRWTGLAILDGVRDAGNRWIFPELIKEGWEPWNRVRMVCINGSPVATHAVDVTAFLERGIASLKKHRTYIEHLKGFDPESFLRRNAEDTGRRFQCRFVVAFEVIHI